MFKIQNRLIGPGHPTFIIAEMSANHGQSFDEAVKIVHAAKEAGADAIKFQTYTPDTITLNCRNEYFMIGKGTIWEGKNLYDLYGEAYTPWEWQPKLKKLADELGLICFSSPFDSTSVDFLEQMNVPAYKIASFELVDIPLIEKVAKTKKPVIMSTGMGSLKEIELAVKTLKSNGCSEIALLKCTSAYPSPYEEMNLRTIPDLANRFQVTTGLSDHSLGFEVSIAAVALGATIVEKHFTLDRSQKGPDSEFSMEPHEFKMMVKGVRCVEKSLGRVQYELTDKEKNNRVFRKSIFVSNAIKKGDVLSHQNVRVVRPGQGLSPSQLKNVLGKKANVDLDKGTPLNISHFE